MIAKDDYGNFDKQFLNEDIAETPFVGVAHNSKDMAYEGFSYAKAELQENP